MLHAIALLIATSTGAVAPTSFAQDAAPAQLERILHVHSQVPAWRTFRREGQDWRYPMDAIGVDAVATDDAHRTVAFGESVRFGFAGFAPEATVVLRVAFLSDSDERVVQVVVDGEVVERRVALPYAELVRREVAVPTAALADGRVELGASGGHAASAPDAAADARGGARAALAGPRRHVAVPPRSARGLRAARHPR